MFLITALIAPIKIHYIEQHLMSTMAIIKTQERFKK